MSVPTRQAADQAAKKIAATAKYLTKQRASAEGIKKQSVARDAERLLGAAVRAALELTNAVSPGDMARHVPIVEELLDVLVDGGVAERKLRLADKLSNTAGRTPEEAALYEEKAEHLRR